MEGDVGASPGKSSPGRRARPPPGAGVSSVFPAAAAGAARGEPGRRGLRCGCVAVVDSGSGAASASARSGIDVQAIIAQSSSASWIERTIHEYTLRPKCATAECRVSKNSDLVRSGANKRKSFLPCDVADLVPAVHRARWPWTRGPTRVNERAEPEGPGFESCVSKL